MQPSRRILVPVQGPLPPEGAVRYAADLAAATGAEVHLVFHGDEPEGASAEERLRVLAGPVEAHGVPVRTARVGRGESEATGLLDACAEADLVVLSAPGDGGRGPELGPLASAVVEGARCPDLLVGPEAGRVVHGLRVLVPLDLSAASREALREARALAASLGGVVEVVHAVPDEVESAQWGGEAVEAEDDPPVAQRLRRVERFVGDAGGDPVPILIRLVEGPPVEAIARVAREDRPDLVVAGRPPQRPAGADALLNAVRIAARCPSLSVPVR